MYSGKFCPENHESVEINSIGGWGISAPMGNSASLNSSVLRLIFGNKQTMLNAKTIGFLLIIMSNHDLHPYHEEIRR